MAEDRQTGARSASRRRGRVPILALVIAVVAACERGPAPAPPGTAVRISAPATPEKPSAPARLALSTRPRADGRVEVELRATPTADVDALELVLELDGTKTRAHFGATPAGTARAIVRTATVGAAAVSRGAVRTHVGTAVRARAVGAGPAARPAPPRRIVDVPGVGRVAVEGP